MMFAAFPSCIATESLGNKKIRPSFGLVLGGEKKEYFSL